MQKSLTAILLFVSIICLFCACSNKPKNNYAVGLKVLKEFDSSRKFDTTGSDKAPYYYRPVKIDIFYPSSEESGKDSLTYGNILDMYEQRMNFDNPLDSCKKVSLDLAKAIAEYLHVDSASKILNYKLPIYSDLAFPTKKFPLIVYAAGMNGSSWENAVLFDSLATNGYIVAAVSSVGKFPGYMSSAVDVEEQVNDILFTIKKMKTLPFVDEKNIGLLGWSLGGTAITKAAMLSNDVNCLISFDGTEIHYYGSDTAWDKEYNDIMQIPPFQPGKITVPYMYLSSEHPKDIDSIYVFPEHTQSKEKYFLQFNNAIHEDFSSIVTIAKVADKKSDIDSSRHETICKLTLTFFDQYLKRSPVTSASFIDHLTATKPNSFSVSYPKK
jgi:hypothetical protein